MIQKGMNSFRIKRLAGSTVILCFFAAGLMLVGCSYVESPITSLKDEDIEVRVSAAEALGQLKDPRAVEPLITALKDEHSAVRGSAANALMQIGQPAVEPPIAVLKQKDEDKELRLFVAGALGRLKDPRAVEPLIMLVKQKDEDWPLRESAAEALEQIEDPRVVETLTAFAEESEARAIGAYQGSAYVFTRSGNTWTEQQKLIASEAGDMFGCNVALDGNTALIGAYEDDVDPGSTY